MLVSGDIGSFLCGCMVLVRQILHIVYLSTRVAGIWGVLQGVMGQFVGLNSICKNGEHPCQVVAWLAPGWWPGWWAGWWPGWAPGSQHFWGSSFNTRYGHFVCCYGHMYRWKTLEKNLENPRFVFFGF